MQMAGRIDASFQRPKVHVHEPLNYRDGHETNVDPVLIDRPGDGSVRVVVRYPPQARLRARNRFIITLAVVVAWNLLVLWMMHWWMIAGVLGSLWIIGVLIVGVTAILWWRSGWLYVFEADASELSFALQGYVLTRRRRYRREWLKGIQVVRDRRGRAESMEILTTNRRLNRRFLDFLGEKHVTDVVDALREGLAMTPHMEADQAEAE